MLERVWHGRATLARVVAMLGLCGLAAQALAVGGTLAAIPASTGTSSPTDGTFGSFLTPVINSVGTVTFNARLQDTSEGNISDSGIYRFSVPGVLGPVSVELVEVLRENQAISLDAAVYTAGDLFLTASRLENAVQPGSPAAGNFSQLAVELPVRAGFSGGDSAIVVQDAQGDFTLVAREGAEVPSGNGEFGDLTGFNLFGVTANGGAGFFAAMTNTDAGSTDNTGLFRYSPAGTLTELVRKGDAAPGAGGTLDGVFTPRMNNLGAVAYLAGIDSPSSLDDSALVVIPAFSNAGTLRVREGDAVPSGNGEFAQLGQLRINDHEHIAFTALLRNTDGLNGSADLDNSGLYLHDGATLTELVREGDLIPSGDARFGRFADPFSGDVPRPAFNNQDQAAFRVDLLEATPTDDMGIFRVSPSEIIEIARAGDAFDDGTFVHFEAPALNHQGAVAFLAEIDVGTVIEDGAEGPVTLRETALLVSDGIDMVVVARENEVIGGRTLFDIEFSATPTGAPNGLSDSALVTYEAHYVDGTSAINVWKPGISWRAAGDGQWDDAENWFLGMRPMLPNDITIESDTDIDVSGPSEDTAVVSLQVGGGGGVSRLSLGSGVLRVAEGTQILATGVIQGAGELAGEVVNHGQLHANAGTLSLWHELYNEGLVVVDGDATVALLGGYRGSGAIIGSGLTRFAGGLRPGNSPTLLAIEGDVVLEPGNLTVLELGGLVRGDEYDAIDVAGNLTLGGTLEIELIDGHTLVAGQSYLLFEAGTLTGEFDELIAPEVTGLTLVLLGDATSLSLQVQAVPLPPSAWLALCAFGALLARRRIQVRSSRDG